MQSVQVMESVHFAQNSNVFSSFSISLLQAICITRELEILMWQAHPWHDLPVNVNFGATSNEQSTSFTELPLLLTCDAISPGTDLQSCE